MAAPPNHQTAARQGSVCTNTAPVEGKVTQGGEEREHGKNNRQAERGWRAATVSQEELHPRENLAYGNILS